MTEPVTSATLTALTEASWQRWLDTVARMPADQIDIALVCGVWTTKDLLGHIPVWDAVAIDKIREIQEGVPWHRMAVDDRNAQEAALRAERTVAEQTAEMQMTHQRLLAALDAASGLSSDDLQRVSDTIAEDTWEHYAVHTAEIERWLADHSE